MKALSDPDSSVRESAVVGLGKSGTPEAVSGLLKALYDSRGAVREAAASALGDVKAQQAVPELIKVLEDPDSLIQKVVICSLEKIGTQEAVSGLVRATENPDTSVRKAALKALERINKSHPSQVRALNKAETPDEAPVLRNCLTGDNAEARIETANLFENIHNTNSLKELELSVSFGETEESRTPQNMGPLEKKGIRLSCPYCSRNLKLSIAPNFCPFCGMKLKLKY